MRPLIAVAVIIVFTVTMMQLGFCQGETACVRTCQTDHCGMPNTESMDCSNDAFRACAAKCREAAP
jgi:hypothetical protein